MLQALACQRRASRRTTDQESTRLLVSTGPDKVPDTLEAKHRVVDVERHHRHVVVGISGASCGPGTKRAGLVDALLENLSLFILAVVHEFTGVNRLVQLTFRGVNPDLAEHALHAEGTCLIGNDRHDVFADLLVTDQRRKNAHESHRRRRFAFARPVDLRLECLKRRHRQRFRFPPPFRQETA